MTKYLFLFFILIHSLCFSWSFKELNEIQRNIDANNFKKLPLKFKNVLSNKSSLKFQLEANHLYGDFLNDKGDFDEAFKYWTKSNELRSKVYPKDNYQKAWKYALISHYYYQKVEPVFAHYYIDSCIYYLEKVDKNQLDIYKIWNIIAQSKKQRVTYNPRLVEFYLETIQPYYYKSIKLLEAKKPSLDLAISYHLLANSFTDLINSTKDKYPQKAKLFKEKAETYYDKSLSITNELYGKNHFHNARSLFVKALVNYYYNQEDENKKILALYEQAINIYALDSNNFFASQSIMCLSLYQKQILYNLKKKYDAQLVKKFDDAADLAKLKWLDALETFGSKNTNQLFSAYGLNPFINKFELENLKRKQGRAYSKDSLYYFLSNLKYIDHLKWQNKTFNDQKTSIISIQESLHQGEVYLDFCLLKDNFSLFIITKKDVQIIDLEETQLKEKCEKLTTSINQFDFDNFTQLSRELYSLLKFNHPKILNAKKIIICPDYWLALFPFETLLTSSRGVSTKNYAKLDYLIKSKQITYVLFPSKQLERIAKKQNWSISLFAVSRKDYSPLPFSQALLKEFSDQNEFKYYNASKNSLLSTQTSILHLSSHGVYDDKSKQTELILSHDNFKQNAIYDCQIKNSLIVLNTCNSGKGKYRLGDGLDGFVRNFIFQKVPNVISNRWEVDDEASNLLLSKFYKKLKKGNATTQTLKDVQLTFINSTEKPAFANPYYWAGHQLYGHDIYFKPPSETFNYSYFWFGIIPIVLIPIIKKPLRKSLRGL